MQHRNYSKRWIFIIQPIRATDIQLNCGMKTMQKEGAHSIKKLHSTLIEYWSIAYKSHNICIVLAEFHSQFVSIEAYFNVHRIVFVFYLRLNTFFLGVFSSSWEIKAHFCLSFLRNGFVQAFSIFCLFWIFIAISETKNIFLLIAFYRISSGRKFTISFKLSPYSSVSWHN